MPRRFAVHADVEPIPWKTGRVGVVGGDRRRAASRRPHAAAHARPAAAAVTRRARRRLDGRGRAASAASKARASRRRSSPGSGIPPRRIAVILKWARRVSQVAFFALFMYFLFQTAFRGSFAARADAPVRLPLPVEAFLLADPFVGAMTLLSTHTVYRGLLWSVGLLALTMVFGRVFCGWICPFGTLHHFFAWLLPSRQRARRRRASRPTRRTPTSARSTTCSTRSSSRASPGAPSAASSIPSASPSARSASASSPALQYLSHRGLGAAQDVHSRARAGRGRPHAGLPRADRLAEQAVLLPPDLVHRLPARRGPLREPVHPALLVPRALPARRVPRRLLALRALRDDEGPREVHRLQPVPRALPGRRLARRAA